MANIMSKTGQNGKKNESDDILEALLDDPTKSVREIAKDLNTYRQKVWRRKKKLEDEHVIWGYTAVIDEMKLNNVRFLILMKTRPMSEGLAELMTNRVAKGEPRKQGVRLINLCYVNGEFDWILIFSAPDHSIARRYYDTLRLLYDEFLLEKPLMVNVDFCMVADGKTNPDLKQIFDFIPK